MGAGVEVSTRANLLKAAADAADAAAKATGPAARIELAQGAKVALEAAALAEGMPADEIAAAVDRLHEQLAAVGLDKAAANLEPAAFLAYLLDLLGDWRALMLSREGFIKAYERLHELGEGLERDFIAGDTETSRRLAARVHSALEEAEQLLTVNDTSEV